MVVFVTALALFIMVTRSHVGNLTSSMAITTPRPNLIGPLHTWPVNGRTDLMARFRLADWKVGELDSDGHLTFPANVISLRIQVGTNKFSEQAQTVFDFKLENQGVVIFEPQLEEFMLTWSAGVKALGFMASNTRFKAFPLAVSSFTGFATFFKSRAAGCSSLLPSAQKGGSCATVQESVCTPTIRFTDALKYLSPKMPIEEIMVDAQGFDYGVISTITSDDIARHRIKRILIECQDLPPGHKEMMYKGQPSCGVAAACAAKLWNMRADFPCIKNSPKDPHLRERNCIFVSKYEPNFDHTKWGLKQSKWKKIIERNEVEQLQYPYNPISGPLECDPPTLPQTQCVP